MINVTQTPYNVPIDGTDATTSLQAALNGPDTDLYFPAGTAYSVNGLKIPSGKRLHMTGATFITPPATRMSAFETVVGSSDIRIFGGSITCQPAPPGALGGVGFRGNDCEALWLINVTVIGWPLDCAYFGGNTGCRGLRVEHSKFYGAKRNCVSITNAEDVCLLDCEFADTIGNNPGAGCDLEPNLRERVADIVFAYCRFVRCNVGLYAQRGKGLRGKGFLFANSQMVDCRKYGVVLNELEGARFVGNTVYGCPVGVSVGASTETMRTKDFSVAGNKVTGCPLPLVLAGVEEGQIVGNILSGHVAVVGLGISGEMVFLRNENSLDGGAALPVANETLTVDQMTL